MSSKSLTPEERTRIKSAIPVSTHRIVTAAPARIYFALPQQDKWSYSGLQGALAFTFDKSKDAFVFKLVDFIGTRGVIWHHELYAQFEYFKDRPFFHSFPGDKCMIGVVFAEEKDANLFYKKVINRKPDKATKVSPQTQKVKRGGKIDKSMISAPQQGSFKHVAHVGFDAEKGYTSNNVDQSWLDVIQDLKSHGVTEDVIEENMDFIRDFIRDAQMKSSAQAALPPKKKPPPPPVPRRGAHATSNSVTSTDGVVSPPPPQAPPRQPPQPSLQGAPKPTNGNVGPSPPQPPARQPPRSGFSVPPVPRRDSVAPPNPSIPPPPARPPPSRPVDLPPAPPPSPPPPPVRPAVSPPTRHPPPTRPQNSTPPEAPSPPSPPPPPPPPPPPLTGPRFPSPAEGTAAPPAPPPPPGVTVSMPPAQPGRADLLASIRGQSVANLRKTPASSSTPAPPPASTVEESGNSNGASGGSDLTAALAAALLQRNKKLGDSDVEDEDDEEWD